MRTKSRHIITQDKARQWEIYEYVKKVIRSCRTYEHLLTTEGWLYQITDFTDWDLHRSLIDILHEREHDIQFGLADKELQ